MSTSVLPTVPGISWPVTRSPVWETTVQQAISGKETRIATQSYPRWKWQLSYNILRSAAAFAEYQSILGFFNGRQGMFDTFLYQDSDDNAVTFQSIGAGDGTTTVFQLIRTFGAFNEPVLAPNVVGNVYLNGVAQSPSSYTVTNWGTANAAGPGNIIFNSAPGNGVGIRADFSYYWPCRFDMDSADFSQFLNSFYELKKLSIISVKN